MKQKINIPHLLIDDIYKHDKFEIDILDMLNTYFKNWKYYCHLSYIFQKLLKNKKITKITFIKSINEKLILKENNIIIKFYTKNDIKINLFRLYDILTYHVKYYNEYLTNQQKQYIIDNVNNKCDFSTILKIINNSNIECLGNFILNNCNQNIIYKIENNIIEKTNIYQLVLILYFLSKNDISNYKYWYIKKCLTQ